MKKIFFNIIVLFLFLYTLNCRASGTVKINGIDSSANFPEVTLKVNIKTDSLIPKYDLDEENISVLENGYKANFIKVTGKEPEKSEMVYFVLSVDSSKSISEKYLESVKKSIIEILTRSENNEKIAVFRFNDRVVLLNDFNSDRNTIIQNVEKIEREGRRTVLFDSIYDSISLLKSTADAPKSIIIFTDGKDEGSSVTADDVIDFAKSSSIPLHFMCMNSSVNISKMQRISRLTGGRMILGENISELPSMYRNLLGDINSEYVINYTSQLKPGMENIPVKVTVKYDGLEFNDTSMISIPGMMLLNFKPDMNLLFLALILIMIIIIIFLLLRIISLKKLNFRHQLYSGEPSADDAAMDEDSEEDDNYLSHLAEHENRAVTDELKRRKSTYDAWLIQKNGFQLGEKFPIYWKEITLGRSQQNSIVINDDRVQDCHVKIKEHGNRYIILDMATDYGTFLNGAKLLRPKELYDWDEIKIGNTVFVFRGVNAR